MDKLCDKCDKLLIASGQAFRNYICAHCFKKHSHPNTNTPKICRKCAEDNNRCQRCCSEVEKSAPI